ncbi:MAG: tetratricopeptide repeat protein, partial [Fimbriimonadaceae bacterium]|nr:tetratricopeptide repeat protein [Chitinophagales bacterium]
MKNLFYSSAMLLLLSITVSTTSCSESNGKNNSSSANVNEAGVPVLLERSITTGSDEETNNIRTTYDNSILAVTKNALDYQSYINLATVFITEGRITGNLAYYNEAAMQMLDKVIDAKQPNKDIVFQALSYKSAVLLSMHQFQQALDVAKQGAAINDKYSGIYGAMIDANVELGNYAEAVQLCDKMLALRPDLRSYSRASYIRQIYGDNRGAIDAMKMAVDAGVPGAENTEWARVTLGDLYLNIGAIDTAEMLYKETLTRRPNYVYAEVGLAKTEKAKKNYDAA